MAVTHWAKMSDGSALPSWLGFNTATRTFSGQPTMMGKLFVTYGVTVTYTSPAATHEAISTFIINVLNGPATLATQINSASPVVGTNYQL